MLDEAKRDRHAFFYIDSRYDDLHDQTSNPLKVIRIYLSRAPLPRLSMVYVTALFAGASLTALGTNSTVGRLGAIATTTATGLLTLWTLNLCDEMLDLEADRVAHPERPIASNAVTIRDTLLVAIALLATCVALNFGHALRDGLFYSAMIGLDLTILLLSGRLKIPAVNELIVPALWAAMPIYMFWVLNPAEMPSAAVLALFCYMTDLASDIPGGIQDLAGDLTQGIRTVAGAIGTRGAAITALLVFTASALPLRMFLVSRNVPRWCQGLELLMFLWALLAFVRLVRDGSERNCQIARAIAFHFVSLTYIFMGVIFAAESALR